MTLQELPRRASQQFALCSHRVSNLNATLLGREGNVAGTASVDRSYRLAELTEHLVHHLPSEAHLWTDLQKLIQPAGRCETEIGNRRGLDGDFGIEVPFKLDDDLGLRQ